MSLINENKDFGVIAELIPNNASVIDVGCNDGSLLEYLREYKNIDGRGMEIDQKKVQLCLAKGISVIEGDADTDLLNRKMPVSKKLSYSWHETPNLHFCTINDFIDLCEELEIKIEKKGDLSNKKLSNFSGKNFLDSYFNEVGLFLVSKD